MEKGNHNTKYKMPIEKCKMQNKKAIVSKGKNSA
jgi:hypothetical protein